MSVDPSRDDDPVEQLLLTAYPNPERKGCPGPQVLSELANQKRDPKDDAWYHVWHCSPCYAEFKALRDARWAREKRQAEQIKRRSWLSAAAGLVVAAGAGGFVWFQHEQKDRLPVQITLDLSSIAATRGEVQDHPVKLTPLPRKIDDIKIILPQFSDQGEYQIAILRSKASNSAVAVSKAQTVEAGGQITLSVRMDLSSVPPGTYLLGTRVRERDQIYYYPLQVV